MELFIRLIVYGIGPNYVVPEDGMRWYDISIMSCYKGCLLSAPVITRSTARLFLTSRSNESRSIVTRRNIYSIINILDMLVHGYR